MWLTHKAANLVCGHYSSRINFSFMLQNASPFCHLLIYSISGSFSHGFTYSGHPVACAVAIETLKIYKCVLFWYLLDTPHKNSNNLISSMYTFLSIDEPTSWWSLFVVLYPFFLWILAMWNCNVISYLWAIIIYLSSLFVNELH